MSFMSKKQQSTPRRRLGAKRADEPRQRVGASELSSRYSFRRNRTLTGSLSSDVVSVSENTAELRSARVHSHHLRRHRRHALLWLFVVLATCGLLLYVISQSILRVSVVSSVAVANAGQYEQKVSDYLHKHPLERFRFSLSTQSLVSYLQANSAPEVQSIDNVVSSGQGFGEAVLRITFRKPVVVWKTAGTTMYVDANGNSFTENHYTQPSVQVVDQTGIQSQNNQVLASNRFLAFIGKVVGRMQSYGYTVTEISLPANTTRQVQVRLQGIAYPVKFSIDREVGEQAEDASRAITYLSQKGTTVEYLDVRVSGKAFYK